MQLTKDQIDQDGFFPIDKLILSKQFIYELESELKTFFSINITICISGFFIQTMALSYEYLFTKKKTEKTEEETPKSVSIM